MSVKSRKLSGRFDPVRGVVVEPSSIEWLDNDGFDMEIDIAWPQEGTDEKDTMDTVISFRVLNWMSTLLIDSPTASISIKVPNTRVLRLFLIGYWQEFIDAIASLLWFREYAGNLWWITPAQRGSVWVVALIRELGGSHWYGYLAQARSMEQWLESSSEFARFFCNYRDYATNIHSYNKNEADAMDEEMHEAARELQRYLGDDPCGMGLPMDFPFLNQQEWSVLGSGTIIKVHPQCMWFLCIPLDFIFSSKGSCHQECRHPEWIATGKALSIHMAQKSAVLKGLIQKNSGRILIILNEPYGLSDDEIKQLSDEYREWYEKISSLLKQGIGIATEMLQCCADDCSGNGQESSGIENDIPFKNLIRWTKNPSAEKLREILSNQDTWYVFANFHNPDNIWQLGGRENNKIIFDPRQAFAPNQLRHLRLMRIFHCNSLGYLYPSSRATLVQALLEAGAWRVEGSLLTEDTLDFLAFILRFLIHDLGMQVSYNCLSQLGSVESANLYQRAEFFLEKAGYPLS